MHTGGTMNAGQAPYQKAANDECKICGGKRIDSLVLLFLLSRRDRKIPLTFNVILILIIITHTSQALVTGKRS